MSAAEFERQQLVQRLVALQNQIAYTRMAIATTRDECERNIGRIVNDLRAVEEEYLRVWGVIATSPEEAAQIEEQKRRLLLRRADLQRALENAKTRCNRRLTELQNELNQLLSEFEQVRQRLFRLGGGV